MTIRNFKKVYRYFRRSLRFAHSSQSVLVYEYEFETLN
jgi:hypothetical protein